jgi:putative Mn2+ efflux pump MntP
MSMNGRGGPTRAQLVLGAATLVAYAVGYPVAIIGGSPIGWILVTLGGLLLVAFGVATVRWLHRGASRD